MSNTTFLFVLIKLISDPSPIQIVCFSPKRHEWRVDVVPCIRTRTLFLLFGPPNWNTWVVFLDPPIDRSKGLLIAVESMRSSSSSPETEDDEESSLSSPLEVKFDHDELEDESESDLELLPLLLEVCLYYYRRRNHHLYFLHDRLYFYYDICCSLLKCWWRHPLERCCCRPGAPHHLRRNLRLNPLDKAASLCSFLLDDDASEHPASMSILSSITRKESMLSMLASSSPAECGDFSISSFFTARLRLRMGKWNVDRELFVNNYNVFTRCSCHLCWTWQWLSSRTQINQVHVLEF